MPAPGVPQDNPAGIKATIYVYEATRLDQVERIGQSAFYSAIHTRFVKTVDSDSSGRFTLALPAGRYSLFSKIEGNYYANRFDDQNYIALVTVEEGKVAEVNITVSAKASY